MRTGDVGMNRVNLGVVLMLSKRKNSPEAGTGCGTWSPRVPGLKGSSYPNFISAAFHPQSHILHFVVIESKWCHHQPHCLGQKNQDYL